MRNFPSSFNNFCLLLNKIIRAFNVFITKTYLKTLFKWIRSHQKSTSLVSVVLLTGQVWLTKSKLDSERKEVLKAKDKISDLKVSNEALRSVIANKTVIMENFDWPWYRKTKRSRNFYITGLNGAYERYYKVDRFKALGKTNFDIAPYDIAKTWNYVDSLVAATGKPKDTVEYVQMLDSSRLAVLSHKWSSIEGRDTTLYGVSVPISKFIAIIDRRGNLEVIEIISDTIANAIQDTIYRK